MGTGQQMATQNQICLPLNLVVPPASALGSGGCRAGGRGGLADCLGLGALPRQAPELGGAHDAGGRDAVGGLKHHALLPQQDALALDARGLSALRGRGSCIGRATFGCVRVSVGRRGPEGCRPPRTEELGAAPPSPTSSAQPTRHAAPSPLTHSPVKPPSCRSDAITRWHGTLGAKGLRRIAWPTARALEGGSSARARSPYVVTRPLGMAEHTCRMGVGVGAGVGAGAARRVGASTRSGESVRGPGPIEGAEGRARGLT
jgi:hypothetical protein